MTIYVSYSLSSSVSDLDYGSNWYQRLPAGWTSALLVIISVNSSANNNNRKSKKEDLEKVDQIRVVQRHLQL